jgi:hypothetical protein
MTVSDILFSYNMYKILPYTKERAKELGLVVKPSSDPKKKLDVYKDDEFLCSIGANGMGDYPTYFKLQGEEVANERRRLFHLRTQHAEVGSKQWLSKLLLW